MHFSDCTLIKATGDSDSLLTDQRPLKSTEEVSKEPHSISIARCMSAISFHRLPQCKKLLRLVSVNSSPQDASLFLQLRLLDVGEGIFQECEAREDKYQKLDQVGRKTKMP